MKPKPTSLKKQPRTTAYPKATLKTHLQLSLLNVVLILKNVKGSELQAHRCRVVMIINATNDYVLQKIMKPECRAGVCYEVIEGVPITFDQYISQLFMITRLHPKKEQPLANKICIKSFVLFYMETRLNGKRWRRTLTVLIKLFQCEISSSCLLLGSLSSTY